MLLNAFAGDRARAIHMAIKMNKKYKKDYCLGKTSKKNVREKSLCKVK